MTWTLDWHPAARRDLLELPMRTAERLDAAVIKFAATNRGPVFRASEHDPRQLKLVVTGAVALMNADPISGMLLVTRVFRRA